MFVYREKYYEPNCGHDNTELIISKNRHGELGTVNLKFNGALMQFTEVDDG